MRVEGVSVWEGTVREGRVGVVGLPGSAGREGEWQRLGRGEEDDIGGEGSGAERGVAVTSVVRCARSPASHPCPPPSPPRPCRERWQVGRWCWVGRPLDEETSGDCDGHWTSASPSP